MQTTCKICRNIDDPEEYIDSRIKEIMVQKEVCFHCAFWYYQSSLDLIGDNRIPIIVNHTHWCCSPYYYLKEDYNCLNFILFKDGRVIKTSHLTHQGNIPEPFWEELPNNAVFISFEDYYRILKSSINKSVPPVRVTCPQNLLKFLLKKYDFSK